LIHEGLGREKEISKKFLPKFMGNESSSSSRLSIVPTSGITLQIKNIKIFFILILSLSRI
jgi:hypothetical protein